MRITKENLTRYDQHFKSWQRRRLGYGKALENWHQTEEAGAVQFYPVGGSPLEGTVKFLFKEVSPASGEKSPTNPSTLRGVNTVKLTAAGKNFFVPASSVQTVTSNDVTLTVNQDFTYVVNGTASADIIFYLRYNGNNSGIHVKSDKTYTFSGCPAGGSASTYRMAWHPAVGGNVYDYGDGVTVVNPKVTATLQSFNCQIQIFSGTTVSNLLFKPQVEIGSSVTEYETPQVVEPTISLGNTYYGGEIDLATGVMTVTWAHQTVTGGASNLTTIDASTLQFRFSVTSGNHVASDTTNLACNRFIPGSTLLTTGYASQLYYARIAKSLLDVSGAVDPSNPTDAEWLAAINSWLSSNNIEIAYKLATPTTVQLDPISLTALTQTNRFTPRLNTVYTDADSIQITYQKSPIRAATEQEMAILGLGGNV